VQYWRSTGDSVRGLDNQQPTRVKLIRALSGSTHGKVWVLTGLRYMLLPPEMVTVSREITVVPSGSEVSAGGNACIKPLGRKELACGSQAPIATLLFDPSMSALPIIVKHNSQRVGLFTR
jgi:hypothetical protein